MNYDPLYHPFELPVQILQAHCIAEQPFYLPPRPGVTPGTTLSGAFGAALWSSVCCCRKQPVNPCLNEEGAEPCCRHPEQCPVPWLYKPYSEVHRRGFTRPVLFRSDALEELRAVTEFDLRVTLWGRHAIDAVEDVKAALRRMGELGLSREGERVRFHIEQFSETPGLTLTQRVALLHRNGNVMLEFHTPFLHQMKNNGIRHFHTRPELPLADILGNAAYTLAAWDIEDRALKESLDKKIRHNLSRDSRDAARAAGESLTIRRAELTPVELGERFSRSTGQNVPLYGFIGQAELTGDLDAAMPWLLTLALAGGGQKRALGFGGVRMWFEM
ncbi:MAG: hypothetical protein GY862_07745 [Gammaproteobacteria bacterium]|nr:hypothetical protein [Gammaproteobacteria bacterium]